MSELHLELMLTDAAATEALGAALARAYRGGGSGARTISDGRGSTVVFLHGELGAGKSTCVRGLLRALGVDGLIRSPTYTLVEAYQPRGITCIHVDLYRLQGPVDVEELGLRDFLGADCLLLVEWPEKGGAALPPADIDLTLTYSNLENSGAAASRQAHVRAPTARGRRWLEMLLHDTSLTAYVSNST